MKTIFKYIFNSILIILAICLHFLLMGIIAVVLPIIGVKLFFFSSISIIIICLIIIDKIIESRGY